MMYYFNDHDLVRLRPARLHLESLLSFVKPPVLDIGKKPYTAHYEALIQGSYLSVDRDARRKPDLLCDILEAEFIEAAKTRFPSYETILFVGMIGFGIDRPEQILTAFRAFHALLNNQGTLLIGWNEPFLPRVELASMSDGYELGELIEPSNNPEQLYFWNWKKVDTTC